MVVERLVAGLPDRDWVWIVRHDEPGFQATDYAASSAEHRRSSPVGAQVRTITSRPRTGGLLQRVGWFAFKPGGTRVAPALFELAYGGALSRQLPAETAHIHWVGTGIELFGHALLRAARQRGIPFTLLPAMHPGDWGDAPIDIHLYRHADAVLALTNFERAHLVARGVPAGLVRVVPLGPTLDLPGDGGRFRARHGLSADRPVIAAIGRRSSYKGLRETLEAAARVRAAGRDVVVAVAGPPGDLPPELFTGDDVLDLGFCDQQTKADLLDASFVLCAPSTSESLGIVYLDAWAAGRPVIASGAPAVRELVTDGKDGLIVEQTPEAVAAALQCLLDAPDDARSMGERGRRKQQQRYTWAAFADAHRAVFAAAAESASATGR